MKAWCVICNDKKDFSYVLAEDSKTGEPYADMVCDECFFVIATLSEIDEPHDVKSMIEKAGIVGYGEDAGQYVVPNHAMLDRVGRIVEDVRYKERVKWQGALTYAVDQADGWHDESRGGPMDGALMEQVRLLIRE